MTTLISERMRRRLTSLDVILKAPTVYRCLHQQELMGKQVIPPVDRRHFEAELPTTFGRMTPCMGRCSWWAASGAGSPSSSSSTT
ncbi:hypothetical protein DFAR_270008 [Desulfarculales bacterium]